MLQRAWGMKCTHGMHIWPESLCYNTYTVFSPRIIQAVMGGHGLGVACGHIKAFGLFPFPHQRSICAEGLQGRHALNTLGRTLMYMHMYQPNRITKKKKNIFLWYARNHHECSFIIQLRQLDWYASFYPRAEHSGSLRAAVYNS